MRIFKNRTYKIIELLVLFIILPVSFAIEFDLILKIVMGFLGFCYVLFILLKIENNKFKINAYLDWKQFWKRTMILLTAIALITSAFVYITDASQLFVVLRNKPLLWLIILFVYSFFSVYPQELIYRTFFFQRYNEFFKSKYSIILINAILFSLAHLFFRNGLVLVLTFFGGILFALTFQKTNSTLLVSIEHAIYGCWLFTVGMGAMLGFPS